MLKPEIAQQRLAEFKTPVDDRNARLIERVMALPVSLRPTAFALVSREADGTPFKTGSYALPEVERNAIIARNEAITRVAGQSLDAISFPEREAIFAALRPKIGRALALYWNPASGFYQRGWSRRAFRLQDCPDLTVEARFSNMTMLLRQTEEYQEQDSVWLATWVGYLPYFADYAGRLLAAVIDGGGDEGEQVFTILLDSARGEQEIGVMGRHVTRGLLSASRVEGWEFMEKFLLAAQRNEGLRQNILETIDEAHPQAFRRMLRLILEHDLMRFSATIRAVDVWLALGWDAPTLKQANTALHLAHDFLFDANAIENTLTTSEDGQAVYIALWALAFDDAVKAMERARVLLSDPVPVRRAAAAHLLRHLDLPQSKESLIAALDDADLRIASLAFSAISPHYSLYNRTEGPLVTTDLFERLERNIARFPKETTEVEPILFPWIKPSVARVSLADALRAALGTRDPERLLPYLPEMSPNGRTLVADVFAERCTGTEESCRTVLLGFLFDSSNTVRQAAIKGLVKYPADNPAIVTAFEQMLTRKSASMRQAVIDLLARQSDTRLLETVDRLLESKAEPQRIAGLGVLEVMQNARRQTEIVKEKVRSFAARRVKPTVGEKGLLAALLTVETATATLDNALGLMDPTKLTGAAPLAPPALLPLLLSPTTPALFEALASWLEERRQVPVTILYGADPTEMLLGNIPDYCFPLPDRKTPLEEDIKRLPLAEDLRTFWENRPEALRDRDSLELLRARICDSSGDSYSYGSQAPRIIQEIGKEFIPAPNATKNRNNIVNRLITWLYRIYPVEAGAADFLLDAAETAFLRITEQESQILAIRDFAISDNGILPGGALDVREELDEETTGQPGLLSQQLRIYQPGEWRNVGSLTRWFRTAQTHFQEHSDTWTPEQRQRLWNLQLFMAQPRPDAERRRPDVMAVLNGYRLGKATEDDLYDCLIGTRSASRPAYYYTAGSFHDLQKLTTRKALPLFAETPVLKEIVDNCRRRALEVELQRGDKPGAATPVVRFISHTGGMDVLLSFLTALGKETIPRGSGGDSRACSFARIIRATSPGETDTPEAFAVRAKAEAISETRLVELAMYAPQWAKHVEQTLQWPAFAEGVWWFHAHTKDNQWSVEAEIKETWRVESADKTPLSSEDLTEGGVDVAWFNRVIAGLGPDRWAILNEAAKLASSGVGHKRAQLYADAMLGRIEQSAIIKRIQEKRHQDSVRALGLLPLPTDPERAETETLLRYHVLQELLRTSKQFGAQRQENEKKAVRIALDNLARTFGYPDPVRLEWAMEAKAVADLRHGPISATADDITVMLSINALGKPDLTTVKKGKVLASIPPRAKKIPEVATLITRRKDIERQVSRMRLSLEEAMIRGDIFTGDDLGKLFEHPVLVPMLRSLVFVEADGAEPILGYPEGAGKQLADCEGGVYPVSADLRLRIAHPFDLLQTGRWDRWQRDCFLRERIQPFKQVFRELYVLTDQERIDTTFSARYAGHQVNPRQAFALLSKRGWVNSYEDATRKTYHHAGITAILDSVGTTFSPLDVEGFTIDDIRFVRRGEQKPMPLVEVPERLFSETMRDLDLVVSVAHMGGVDPEASASTVEMRAALVREAALLLKLTNVRIEKSHVLIDGHLAQYSIHLGSAVVHRQPGGFVCIVPSHAQHRGRLFLPFADDDPRTAEVVSKALLLAKDNEIKDPTILEQLLLVR